MFASFTKSLRERPALWWAERLLMPVAVWLALIKFPHEPGIGLDDSWRMMLSRAVTEGWGHGRDIVFTYGPLGHLMALTYNGQHFYAFILWQLLSNLLFAWIICRFALRLTGVRRAFFYAYLLLLGTIYIDAMQMVQISILAFMLLQNEPRRHGWTLLAGTAFGVFALIKFTNLMLCGFVTVVVAALWLQRRRASEAATLAGAFVVTFLGLWLALGQTLSALPSFLRLGLEVSMGYVEGMAVYEAPAMFACGAGALVALVVYALLYLFSQRDRLLAFASALVLGAVTFLNWKHGFVRADGHVLAHFVICLMTVTSFPALTQDEGRWLLPKQAALLVAAACSLSGVWQIAPHMLTLAPAWFNRRLHDTVAIITDLPGHHQRFNRQLDQLRSRVPHEALRQRLAGAPVDHMGDDQAYSLVNGLNLRPRPALQGYTVYTEALNRLDEAFYFGPRAPKFVLSRFTTIDGRLMTQDDSLALRHVFQNYEYRFESGGLLLFERTAQPVVAPEAGLPPVTLSTRLGEAVSVPDFGGRPVWAFVRVRPTLAGQLRKFLYKLPHLYLRTTDQRGRAEDFLLVRQIAGTTGFILNPLLTNASDVLAFQNEENPRRVASFRVEAMPGGAGWFRSEVEIEFRALNPFEQSMLKRRRHVDDGLPMFNRKVVRAAALAPMTEIADQGRSSLMLHAPGFLEFETTAADRIFEFDFGIMSGAYTNGNTTDGVRFSVEWQDATGATRTLFSRTLTPMTEPAHRAAQHTSIDLSGLGAGRLTVRTDPGPAGNAQCDWAYVATAKFHSAP